MDQVFDGAGGVVGAERLVGYLGERGLVRGRLQHAVEFGLLALFREGLEFARPDLQSPRQVECILDGGWMGRLRVGFEIGQYGIKRFWVHGEKRTDQAMAGDCATPGCGTGQ